VTVDGAWLEEVERLCDTLEAQILAATTSPSP